MKMKMMRALQLIGEHSICEKILKCYLNQMLVTFLDEVRQSIVVVTIKDPEIEKNIQFCVLHIFINLYIL